MIKDEQKKLISAAIIRPNKMIYVGADHAAASFEAGMQEGNFEFDEVKETSQQGFLDKLKKFHDRKAAYIQALGNGQIKPQKEPILYSTELQFSKRDLELAKQIADEHNKRILEKKTKNGSETWTQKN